MSHFTVLVTNTHLKTIDEQLAPFDENLERPLHIHKTKQELIDKEKDHYKRGKEYLERYNADPAEYTKGTSNTSHINWITKEIPKMDSWTDEDFYKEAIKYMEADELDADGNHVTTWNEDAKWDWYSIGGRWAGFFQSKAGTVGKQGHHRAKDFAIISGKEVEDLPESACDVIEVKNIDWESMDRHVKADRKAYYNDEMKKEKESDRFIWASNRDELLKMSLDEYVNQPVDHTTFAVLHDGKWYEKGSMGWWGMVSDEKDDSEWSKKFRELVDSLDPEAEVTIVDCHI